MHRKPALPVTGFSTGRGRLLLRLLVTIYVSLSYRS